MVLGKVSVPPYNYFCVVCQWPYTHLVLTLGVFKDQPPVHAYVDIKGVADLYSVQVLRILLIN